MPEGFLLEAGGLTLVGVGWVVGAEVSWAKGRGGGAMMRFLNKEEVVKHVAEAGVSRAIGRRGVLKRRDDDERIERRGERVKRALLGV